MYGSDLDVATVRRGYELVPARVPSAMMFNYHPVLASQRLCPELGWANYLANAALRELTQGEATETLIHLWDRCDPKRYMEMSLLHDRNV